jgi:iron complex outermembrane recepter protein
MRKGWVFCLAAAMLGFAPWTWAADAPRGAEGSEADEMSEIIVTATRRPTLLEQTPIAITALSGAYLDRQHIEDFSNIAIISPSLVFTALSRQEAYPSIRGTTVGNDAPGSDLGVSIFIDDVPTTGVADNNPNLFDLQSIEVLRGPQGTLFGRNVTGGALVVHTLPPDFTVHEKAEMTYGNYNLFEGRGYLTGPIVDNTLAGKITVDYRRQDGIVNNFTLGDKTDSTSLWGSRAQLLWTPNEQLRVLGGVDYTRDASPYKVQQVIGNFQPSLFPPLSYGPSDTNQTTKPTGNTTTGGGFLRADYTTPVGVFSSITGYRHANSTDFFNTTAEPANELLQRYHVGADQITEEIHWSSVGEQRLNWVTGLFFLNSSRDGIKRFFLNVLPDTLVGQFVPPYTALQFLAVQDQHVHSHSYAAFGDANYAFTPEWKLSVGARYTKEDKSGHSEVNDTSGLSPDLAAEYSHSWRAFNPKATLQFEPNSKVLTYATVASGFKSGGYDLSGTTSEALATPFQPEKVVSYELGIKLSAPEDRLVINAAAYYAKYKDLQVQELQNLITVTGNAGVANIPGFELEATFNPVQWLTLMGNYSYMNAKYTKYVQDPADDFTGKQIPFDAKFHYSLGADLHFSSPHFVPGLLRVGGDVSYQGKKSFVNANDEYSFITNNTKIRGLVNLHANWTSMDQRWEVALWGNNVNNKRYIINATDLTAFYATVPEFFATDAAGNPLNKMYVGDWNTPRMYGLTVTFRH